MTQADANEQLGRLIDELDALAHGLQIPMPDSLHVQAIRVALPSKVQALKDAFVAATGENPWGD